MYDASLSANTPVPASAGVMMSSKEVLLPVIAAYPSLLYLRASILSKGRGVRG